VTFDRGRPLHVFDAAKVAGDLTVRRARTGESILALDGRTYALDDDIVVIADANGPESIAGIMGGEHSGCDETTTDVLVESALWDPLAVAQTGRRLGINSDARYRFERGVDPAFTVPGLDLATRLILDLCGGEPSEIAFAGEIPEREHAIDFPWTEVRRLSGFDIPRAEAKVILSELGFVVAGSGERVKVLPPSWRPDIEGKADLVEEVIRIAGLDRIAPQPLPRLEPGVAKPILTTLQKRTRTAKRELAARGLVEAVTWSFVGHEAAKLFGGGGASLRLANPIAADLSDMRPSLLPGLIAAAGRNADRGFADVALFEVGQCFASDEPEGQVMNAASLRRGQRQSGGGRTALGGLRRVRRRLRRQGGRARAPRRPGRADRRAPGRGRRANLAASRPLGHPPVRPQRGRRVVRRGSPAHPESAGRQGSARSLRDQSRRAAAAAPPPDQDQAEARPLRLSAGAARLRLRGPARGRGGRPPPGGRRGGTQPARRDPGVRHLRGTRRSGGHEVDRHRGHVAAGGADADRRGTRGRVGPHRGRGHEEDRRDAALVSGFVDDIPAARTGPGNLVEALANAQHLPEDALRRAVKQPGRIADAVLALVERAASGGALTGREANLLFWGVHALAAARETRLYEPLLRLARRPDEPSLELLGDAITGTLPRLVVSLYAGDQATLTAAMTDREADEYVRWSLWGRGPTSCSRASSTARRRASSSCAFDAERLARAGDLAWIGWEEAVALLGFRELADRVDAARRDARILEDVGDPEWFALTLADAEAHPGDSARFEDKNLGPVVDVVAELEAALAGAEDESEPGEPVQNPLRHVGRNDPCPCGRGRSTRSAAWRSPERLKPDPRPDQRAARSPPPAWARRKAVISARTGALPRNGTESARRVSAWSSPG
jgi:hypothetical protein